jgi:hypothetical protein
MPGEPTKPDIATALGGGTIGRSFPVPGQVIEPGRWMVGDAGEHMALLTVCLSFVSEEPPC